MKIAFALVLTLTLAPLVHAVPSDSNTVALEEKARAFVTRLAQGDAIGAVKRFSDPERPVLSPEDLRQGWSSVVLQNGAFERITDVRFEKVEIHGGRPYKVLRVRCALARAPVSVHVHFDDRSYVTSFWFVPQGS